MKLNPVEQARVEAVGEAAAQAGDHLRAIVEGLIAAGGPDLAMQREESGLLICYARDPADGLLVATLEWEGDRVLQIRAVPGWPVFIKCGRVGPWAGELASLWQDMQEGRQGPQPGDARH